MEGVSFEEQQAIARKIDDSLPAGMTGKIIAWNLAKDPEGARYVLLGTAFLIAAAALGVFFTYGKPPAPNPPKGEILITAPGQPPRLQEPAKLPVR